MTLSMVLFVSTSAASIAQLEQWHYEREQRLRPGCQRQAP